MLGITSILDNFAPHDLEQKRPTGRKWISNYFANRFFVSFSVSSFLYEDLLFFFQTDIALI